MLSQPATSIYLKTKEPKAGEWISNAIGKVEVERMKETHFDGSRSGKNFALDRQVEPLVLPSEISGLPDRHAFLKLENFVTGFSFPYLDVAPTQTIPFEERDGVLNIPLVAPSMPPKASASKRGPSPFEDADKPLEPAALASKGRTKRTRTEATPDTAPDLPFASNTAEDADDEEPTAPLLTFERQAQ
jgi:hypothetical protein